MLRRILRWRNWRGRMEIGVVAITGTVEFGGVFGLLAG
jgi:hypothetical protein